MELNNNTVFGDTIYELNKSKNVNLRKPQCMPNEADLKQVRKHNIEVSIVQR